MRAGVVSHPAGRLYRMSVTTRPPLDKVPLFLRCTDCDQPFRTRVSFVRPTYVACAWCGWIMRMVPGKQERPLPPGGRR